nr:chalcone isomerase family protein [uncultured Rhodoferax sp.]
MTLTRFLVAALSVTLLASPLAQAATQDIHGVKVEDSAMVSGTKLLLNGAGTRYKGPFKVYVGDLYTSKKVNSLDELMAAPGPKRLTMTFLREIEAGPFGKLLTRGVEDNVPKNEMSKLVPGLIRMGDIFTVNKVLLPGDVITLDWIPGTGMVVTAKGKVQGEPFKEPEFYKAIMSIWFGPVPADFRLKDALLGQK